MMKDIDELYKDMLQNSEVTPPDSLWDKLSARLSVESATANTDGSLSDTISSSTKGLVKGATKIATWKVAAIAVAAGASVATATIISLTGNNDKNVQQQMNKAVEIILPANTVDTVSTDIFSTSTSITSKTYTINDNVSDNKTLHVQPSVDINNVATIIQDTSMQAVEQLSSDTNYAVDENKDPDTMVSTVVYEEPAVQDLVMKDTEMMLNIDSLKNVLQEIKDSVNIIIPNIITPNYDSYNDCWKIVGIEDYYNVHVVIVSRSGMIIYENKRYDNSWCPTDVPDGTYFYAITIISHNYHKKGMVDIRTK